MPRSPQISKSVFDAGSRGVVLHTAPPRDNRVCFCASCFVAKTALNCPHTRIFESGSGLVAVVAVTEVRFKAGGEPSLDASRFSFFPFG